MKGANLKFRLFEDKALLFAGKFPILFYCLSRVKPNYRNHLVNRETQLVVEGFPRSANTFSVVAFEYAQQTNVRLAHHIHLPVQVILGARWRIPMLILLRNPHDAVLSLMIRKPYMPAKVALRHYISFYEVVARYRHAFVLASFEEVTADLGCVIERVNSKFGTRFGTFKHNEGDLKEVFSRIEKRNRAKSGTIVEEQIARPSAYRKALKSQIEHELKDEKATRSLLDEAEAVYWGLVNELYSVRSENSIG